MPQEKSHEEMINKKPTQRILAKRLGLSLGTISLSLKDNPRISKTTRERVKAAAKELGYVVDPRVSNVMGYLKRKHAEVPSAALAYVTRYSEEIHLEEHPVYQNYLLGAKERAKELGYDLNYFNMKLEGLSGDRLTTVLLSRGIEGVIIPPIFSLGEELGIDYTKFASITFGYSLERGMINRVSLDHYLAVLETFEHVAAFGYKKIGFIVSKMTGRVQHRWEAAQLMFQKLHPDQTHIPPLEGSYDRDTFLRWYEKYEPTALICQTLEWAEYLHAEGLRCPEDYGFATLSQETVPSQRAAFTEDTLSRQFENTAGMDQNSFLAGRLSVELLAQDIALNIKGVPQQSKMTLINSEWSEGDTLRKQL